MEGIESTGLKIKMINNAFYQRFNQSVTDCGLTCSQAFILGFIMSRHNTPTYQKDIEINFNIRHPTANGLLKRLVEKGFITCFPCENDKRLKQINVTERALQLHQKIIEITESFEVQLHQNFSDDEVEQLNLLLSKAMNNLSISPCSHKINPTEEDSDA